ncbi:MAG: autotransporter-associated beta strand repeat-containing protein [Thermoguttaceae bacterium]
MSDRQRIVAFSYQRIKIHTLAAIALLLIYPALTKAADNYWNATSGNWSDTNPNPWSLGIEPTSSDNAYIQNGGTASVNQSGEACSYLYLGASGTGNSGTVQMSDGSLTVEWYEYIGYSGTGIFNQTGGTNAFSYESPVQDLYLGYRAGSSGTYDLSGAGQLYKAGEFIGYSGTGTFTQTGGLNSFSSICLGNDSGSSGTYELETGSVNAADDEVIGLSGNGTFNQISGIHTIGGDISLGYHSGANGTYIQSGGSLTTNYFYLGYEFGATGTFNLDTGSLTANNVYIGYSGTGTFKQTSGTNSISEYLTLGNLSGSTGKYDLSGSGQLSAGNEFIGTSGKGTFIQSGGTNTIASTLYIGENSNSNGTYNLSGSGQLSAVREYIGSYGTGTFTQTSGTNTASYIKIGTIGTYILSSGSLNVNGGFENQGVWDLSNSSVIINVPSSIINLSGSVLAAAGNASINLDAHSLLIIPSGSDPANYFAHYNNPGILHQAGSTLDISPIYSIYGIGTINDHVNCQGTLSATPSYFINLNGGLNITNSGIVNLGTGTLYVNDIISGLSDGTLNTGYQYVGSTGTGTFTQTGGINSISSNLYLGYNSGSTGTYNLTSGTLILKSISKGSGTAYFNFGGGILQTSSSFTTSLPVSLTGTGGNANINTAGYAVIFSGVLSGTGGLNKLGSGTLTLSGSNTYSGGTTLYGGYIAASSLGNLGSGNLTFDGGGLTFDGSFDPSSLGITINSGGAIFNHGLNHNPITFSNAVSGSGGITVSGQTTLILSGTNTYSGGTVCAGTIQIGNASALGSGGLTVNSSGTVDLNSYAVNLSSLAGSGSIITDKSVGSGTTTLAVTSSLSTLFAGVIKDGSFKNIAFSKGGIGTLTLSGANTYSGETFINAGKLALTSTGSIGSTPIINIFSGATFDVSAKGIFGLGATQTLMGSGTVIGNVIATSGSHIAPGNSAGTLTFSGNLTLNDGALLDFELANTSANDKISMSNSTLFLNNQDFSDFNFIVLSGFGTGIYTLIDARAISGNLGNNLTGNVGDYSATLSQSGNDLILTVVPEPGVGVLLMTACLAVFAFAKRRKPSII